MHSNVGDMTMLQLQALLLVKHGEPMTMGELAEKLHTTPASTSTLVDRLIKAGWLERKPDPEDRRAWYLSLPENQRQRLREVSNHKVERITAIFNQLTAEERQDFTHLLQRLEHLLATSLLTQSPK